ncbi:flavodoxin family protein [Variovorax sp. VaC1]|uniref:flavodoxin family protein n=1 Tax=Variovorax sp. VaC1 TaxID=3373132 RepID=UPI0037493A45
MNNVLVIVYSYTGTCRRLAQLLCSQQGWEMAEIYDEEARSGVLGNLRCLIDSFFRRLPAIRYDGPPPGDYKAVVLVSPIWGQRLAAPMRTFVDRKGARLPDVALISVMGGRGAPNAVAEIGKLLGRAPLLTTAFTMHEVDDGSCAARLQAFGTAVQSAEDSRTIVRPATLSPQAV